MNGINWLKHFLTVTMTFIAVASAQAFAADVGVSVTIGQPGFYGRIDIGDYPYPQPVLVYPEPVIIHRPAGVVYEPIYMRVPPGHAKRWRYYCGRYNACGQPVYFVQDRWYNEVYVPQYRERHGDREWHEDHEDREWHDRDRGRDHDRDRGGDRGRGRGRGHDRD